MALLSVAIATARTLLNDDVAAVWTDASLLPKAQEAHRELQVKLWKAGSPVVRKQSDPITVLAHATTITSPNDLLAPTAVVEYAATVETLADATEMTESTYLPRLAEGTKLRFWSWKGETFEVLPASVDRKVVVYYRKLITVPTATSDPIGVIFGELYIGARVAAMVHGSVGNVEAFNIISQVAATNFDDVIMVNRGRQMPGEKP